MREVSIIDIDKIVPNKYQPRLDFYDESIKQLSQSIKENGLIQPIVVREVDGVYEIIAGERRYRATKLLNEKTISAIVVDKNDKESANLALVENIQREDLSAIEEALAIKQIMENRNLTQAQIARELGYKQSTVANKVRLLKLPEEVKNAIAKNVITERHARALLKVKDDEIIKVFNTIVERAYNVKKTEEYIKALNEKSNIKIRAVGANVRLGLNTIKESYELCKKSGLDADYNVTEYENEVKVTIRFRK